MKFVSRYANFGFNVEPSSQRWVTDASGNSRQVDNNDGIFLQFKPRGLSYDEQQAAVEIFTKRNPQHPFGASPKMTEDVISAQEALAEGEAHNAHDGFLPFQRIGVFDTEDPSQCQAKWQERAEEALISSMEFGIDLFRIDDYNLIAPWPTYPTAENAKVEGILTFINQGGYHPADVLRYEKATTKRKALMVALETAIAERDAAQVEDQQLAIK